MTKLPAFALVASLAVTGIGCSDVRQQTQSQEVSDDGTTATRTRMQRRETPGGATVEETEVQTRKVLSSPTTKPDATKSDPAR